MNFPRIVSARKVGVDRRLSASLPRRIDDIERNASALPVSLLPTSHRRANRDAIHPRRDARLESVAWQRPKDLDENILQQVFELARTRPAAHAPQKVRSHATKQVVERLALPRLRRPHKPTKLVFIGSWPRANFRVARFDGVKFGTVGRDSQRDPPRILSCAPTLHDRWSEALEPFNESCQESR